jgi:hypothetical protein
MSFLFLEGFGGYDQTTYTTSDNALLLNWHSFSDSVTISSLLNTSEGVKNAFSAVSPYQANLETPFWSETSTIVVGARVKWGGDDWRIGAFLHGSTTLYHFGILRSGHLCVHDDVYLYNSTWTSSRNIAKNRWTYVEFEVYLHSSAGTVDLYIEGQSVGSYTGLNTGSLACDMVRFVMWAGSGGSNWQSYDYMTDVYVDNSTVHGPLDVWYQAANADGSAEGFTPLSGSNYQMVDDLGSDDDATYNSSSAASTKDQIGHSDSLNSAPLALQPLAHARRANDGTAGLKVGILSGATEDLGDASALGDEYAGVSGDIYEVDPNTSAAWTATNADAAETVYQHV